MVFGKKKPESAFTVTSTTERVTSVLGPGINWKGDLRGKGGVRMACALRAPWREKLPCAG